MVSRLSWAQSVRIIPSRYPVVGIFDDVADPADLDVVVALAAATNPRILEESGDLRLVRDADRIAGPGTTPVMAAFTHVKPSRFGDGTYGIYYASKDEATAIAETAYHRGRFLRNSHLPDERLDMRVYAAALRGRFDDIRKLPKTDPLYDPDPANYAAAQRYGRERYSANAVDGIVYASVRKPGGQCAAVFRPRLVTDLSVTGHLEYRFRGYAFEGAFTIGVAGKRRMNLPA